MPQPVQSSGATWMVYFRPAHSRSRASIALKVCWRVVEIGAVIGFDADDRVRADHRALAALDADVWIPDRDFVGQVALLPLRRTGGVGAIDGQGADRQLIAFFGDHRAQDLAHEGRCVCRDRGQPFDVAANGRGHLDFVQVFQGVIDRGQVHLDDRFTFAAVGLADRLLDLLDRLIARQHAGDGEEADLHDRVDAAAHPGVARHSVGVDHVEFQLFVDDLLLDRARQLIPDLIRAKGRVEQEGAARLRSR